MGNISMIVIGVFVFLLLSALLVRNYTYKILVTMGMLISVLVTGWGSMFIEGIVLVAEKVKPSVSIENSTYRVDMKDINNFYDLRSEKIRTDNIVRQINERPVIRNNKSEILALIKEQPKEIIDNDFGVEIVYDYSDELKNTVLRSIIYKDVMLSINNSKITIAYARKIE